ncbi:L-ribulose-5-phosphate 4-epimerase [Fundicoccus culcitae]|uniref:L-ribulose-5-phosphate 4-epimerase n=1 Tax=Fundicoccus culcitae TaxID=2969821 RepID=A0ABY5P9G5_9LACT|nr:L-ribulose-5-phosphate 4-epimerase [Fundicoccus culcitae]UUX35396.1 L-ribulose-5-phosphate 4-epimerase [Fundicoccus culcitae]
MLEELKEAVFKANLELPERGLIKYTWGNVSAFDPQSGYFVIKPSGVDYDTMTADDMVVVDLNNNIIEGSLKPSSDTPTHAVLYKNFPEIRSIVHTHSPWATIWAQAGQDVPAMGTTHADTFYGTVPCARFLTTEEAQNAYEHNTGELIVNTFKERGIDPQAIPAVLLHGHGPFTWGKSPEAAVMNSVVLEEVCKMNFYTRQLNVFAEPLPQAILDVHYLRKHGKNAYYGQSNK